MGVVKSLRKSQNHTRKTFSLKEQSRRRKEDGKITMIISYLLISFAVLVSPNRIVWVLYDHDVFKSVSADTLAYIRMAALVPYTIHACINPIIYSLVDKKFRGNLKYIFLRVTCQKRSAVHVKNKHKGSFNHSERDTSLSNITKSTIRKTSASLPPPPPPPYETAKTSAIKLDSNTQ
ncbi:galanin receptor 2b-like [Clytia hemisphaerica]|uniref:galanin receptor 2b-like n=1 Tax=Clytia hemisphaerica TaxID=252671 RepID=UPI0034D3C9E4